MATKFLEPGGDADFAASTNPGFWGSTSAGTPAVVTDIVHGQHIKSIRYAPGSVAFLSTPAATVADSGSRISFYFYLKVLPAVTSTIMSVKSSGDTNYIVKLRITSAGVLQLQNSSNAQLGSNGSTLATGTWYRLSLAFTVTSTSVNRFEFFKNGVSDISVTNGTLGFTGSDHADFGNQTGDANLDTRYSDHYIDNSSSLTDTGDIWVTAKRPFSNGTTNGFTTQIGSGGSGYGSGHAPQVNERPLNNANGWSMVGAGSAVTEEYNIEGASVGDIDLSKGTVIDYVGWVDAKCLASETASLILNNVTSNISLTSSETLFTKVAGSSSYPAGTGTDIGIITSTVLTTVSLFECGIMVAFIPAALPSGSDTTVMSESGSFVVADLVQNNNNLAPKIIIH